MNFKLKQRTRSMPKPLPTEKVEDAPSQPEDQGDWSLRANGDTYRDRSDESQILINRLERCTASVTGIAGQRGAGKSSLSLRVLEEFEKKGAFTQLIHSPTGYDSQEFLVSVFQRVCEDVVARIDLKFGQADSLLARGKAEWRRLFGILLILLLGVLFSIAGPFFLVDYQNQLQYEAEREKRIKARIKRIEQSLEKISDERSSLSNSITNLRSQIEKFESQKKDFTKLNSRLSSLLRARDRLRDERIFLLRELRRLEPERLNGTTNVLFESFIQVVSFLAIYIIVFFLFRRLMRILGQWYRARKFPRETGLRQLALELSEHLTFQATHSKSIETGLWFSQLTSRFSAGKSLETRPLSLPGLTAQFARFLEQISEVYSGRVVICLDELDKIEDPKDLDELLRGIKGVLGQPNTHFILTVSEDALSRFTRRRLERGMLESAFEDIIFLNRIDLKVAGDIVDVMYPESDRDNTNGTLHISIKLLWLFGNAIPREIKRNALICLEADRHPRKSPPIIVWKLLFLLRMKDMQSWASRVGGDDQITHEFLVCLEKSITLLSGATSYDRKWGKEIVALWMNCFGDLFSDDYQNIAKKRGTNQTLRDARKDIESLAVGRAVVEILIGASALVYVLEDQPKELSAHLFEQLLKIFEFTPSNLAFAGNLMNEYLAEIDMLEIAEETN